MTNEQLQAFFDGTVQYANVLSHCIKVGGANPQQQDEFWHIVALVETAGIPVSDHIICPEE